MEVGASAQSSYREQLKKTGSKEQKLVIFAKENSRILRHCPTEE
jgi:hypothetical protein